MSWKTFWKEPGGRRRIGGFVAAVVVVALGFLIAGLLHGGLIGFFTWPTLLFPIALVALALALVFWGLAWMGVFSIFLVVFVALILWHSMVTYHPSSEATEPEAAIQPTNVATTKERSVLVQPEAVRQNVMVVDQNPHTVPVSPVAGYHPASRLTIVQYANEPDTIYEATIALQPGQKQLIETNGIDVLTSMAEGNVWVGATNAEPVGSQWHLQQAWHETSCRVVYGHFWVVASEATHFHYYWKPGKTNRP